jgi:hypothetical protein
MPDGSPRPIDTARAAMHAGEFDRALGLLESVIGAAPDLPEPHYLRGEVLFLQRRLDEALASHDSACQRGAGDQEARGRCMSGLVPGDFAWMTHMLRGNFERAWALSAAARNQRPARGGDLPRHQRQVWTGEPLAGKHVVVRCHQGLGDSLQFVRYVPLLKGVARSVTLAAPRSLHELFATMPSIDHVDDDHAAEGAADGTVQIELMELAQAFGTTLSNIPADVPYLSVEPGRTAAARLPSDGRLRIGVAWAAGGWKPERSIPLPLLASLRDDPRVALFSLQRGPAAEEWPGFAGSRALGALESDDIVATAATMHHLDLVISVDTMVAHLAGALGVRTWTLLHFAADWRWMLERNDSPWYPTMRLFRQPAPGDWRSVVRAVERTLPGDLD